jgi:putative proteasome-type protease
MTFCLGIKLREGLVAIADTRLTSGSECVTARKLTTYHPAGGAVFVMTSGLRSVRDKTLTYFEEALDRPNFSADRIFKVVNTYSEQLRRVAAEDKAMLTEGGFHFNLHALIGGQMPGDREHKLYLIYPQANWVEIGEGTPYHIIGSSGYGKPVLDRTLKYDDSLPMALKVGCLAFDSTRISAADTDFPIDVLLYRKDSFVPVVQRFEKHELADSARWWQERLRRSLAELPSHWMDEFVARVPGGYPVQLAAQQAQQSQQQQ